MLTTGGNKATCKKTANESVRALSQRRLRARRAAPIGLTLVNSRYVSFRHPRLVAPIGSSRARWHFCCNCAAVAAASAITVLHAQSGVALPAQPRAQMRRTVFPEVSMRALKNTLTALGVIAVVGVTVAVFAPRTVVAQVRAALMRDVDEPSRQAVVIRKFTTTSSFDTVYTVPAGKKFVLEHMNCTSLASSLYAGIFNGTLSHANIVFSVPVINVSGTVLVADAAARVYFDPGTDLNLRIFTTDLTTCTLSGYTVDQ